MLTTEEIRHIALLARIGLKDEEQEKYQHDLSAVLDFFRELEELPTDGILPIGHITGMTNRMREDAAEDFGSVGTQALTGNVPETKDGFIKVRSVF